jgi:hypothetical protein
MDRTPKALQMVIQLKISRRSCSESRAGVIKSLARQLPASDGASLAALVVHPEVGLIAGMMVV